MLKQKGASLSGAHFPSQTSRGGSRQTKRQTERSRGRGQERSTSLQRLKETAGPKGPQQGAGPQDPQLLLHLPVGAGLGSCIPQPRFPLQAPPRAAGLQRVLPSLPAATQRAPGQRGPSQAYHLSPELKPAQRARSPLRATTLPPTDTCALSASEPGNPPKTDPRGRRHCTESSQPDQLLPWAPSFN